MAVAQPTESNLLACVGLTLHMVWGGDDRVVRTCCSAVHFGHLAAVETDWVIKQTALFCFLNHFKIIQAIHVFPNSLGQSRHSVQDSSLLTSIRIFYCNYVHPCIFQTVSLYNGEDLSYFSSVDSFSGKNVICIF